MKRIVALALLVCAAAVSVASQSGPVKIATGSGTGIVVSSDGYVITNEHVIHDASSVTVYAGSQAYAAEVVAVNEPADLALLRISATDMTPVALGNSVSVEVFDEVVAIGYPLPQFGRDLTVSQGNITSIRTNVEEREGRDTFQHDAVIYSGSSGGPLFNARGEVIGINYSVVKGSGLMYAIPIVDALSLLRLIPDFDSRSLGTATEPLTPKEIFPRYRSSVVFIEVQVETDISGLIPAAIPGYPNNQTGPVDTQPLAEAGFGVEAAVTTWCYRVHGLDTVRVGGGGDYEGALAIAILFDTVADAVRTSEAGVLRIDVSDAEQMELSWASPDGECWCTGTWELTDETTVHYQTRMSVGVVDDSTTASCAGPGGDVVQVQENHMPLSLHCPCPPGANWKYTYAAFEAIAVLRIGPLLVQASTYYADCCCMSDFVTCKYLVRDGQFVKAVTLKFNQTEYLLLEEKKHSFEVQLVEVQDLLSEFESVMKYVILHALEQLAKP